MMIMKQAQLKKQAYESSLKSRALSVLIYLIDRSNRELTCFPSISTVAGQLHISVSTVKRALRELEEAGYLKKDPRYRSNQGQTSNLYTLVLQESTSEPEGAAGEEPGGMEEAGYGKSGGEVEHVTIEHVTFETLKLESGKKNRGAGPESGNYQGDRESEDIMGTMPRGIADFPTKQMERKSMCGCRTQRRSRLATHSLQRRAVKFTFRWTGEGVSLHPP